MPLKSSNTQMELIDQASVTSKLSAAQHKVSPTNEEVRRKGHGRLSHRMKKIRRAKGVGSPF